MAHWLLKTEPGEYSYDDLKAAGRDLWDGVRSGAALKHLRAMRPGDLAFIYHSGPERAVVGVARVVSDPYPDPAQSDPRWAVAEVEPQGRLARPVPLAAIKADSAFHGWELVRIPRLSVMPVAPALWERILQMGGGIAP